LQNWQKYVIGKSGIRLFCSSWLFHAPNRLRPFLTDTLYIGIGLNSSLLPIIIFVKRSIISREMLALYIILFLILNAVQLDHQWEIINENHLDICLRNHAIIINSNLWFLFVKNFNELHKLRKHFLLYLFYYKY